MGALSRPPPPSHASLGEPPAHHPAAVFSDLDPIHAKRNLDWPVGMSIGTLERILTLFFNMYTVGEERFGEAILRTHEIRIRHHRTQDLCFCGLLGVVVGWVNSQRHRWRLLRVPVWRRWGPQPRIRLLVYVRFFSNAILRAWVCLLCLQVASLGDHGLIMVLFETPSGFAIFSIDGTPLSRPDAIEVRARFFFHLLMMCLLLSISSLT